jgi:hypothetical protein
MRQHDETKISLEGYFLTNTLEKRNQWRSQTDGIGVISQNIQLKLISSTKFEKLSRLCKQSASVLRVIDVYLNLESLSRAPSAPTTLFLYCGSCGNANNPQT